MWGVRLKELRIRRFEITENLLRSGGLMAVCVSCVFYGLLFAYGRARIMEDHFHSVPAQYALPAAPLLIAVYAYWSLVRPHMRAASAVILGICAGCVLLFPLNAAHGIKWLTNHQQVLTRARMQAESGLSAEQFAAATSRDLLNFVAIDEYVRRVSFLQQSGIAPFRHPSRSGRNAEKSIICPTPPPAASDVIEREVRVHVAGASRAELVWGIDGWNCVSVKQDAHSEGSLLRTALTADPDEPDTFFAQLQCRSDRC